MLIDRRWALGWAFVAAGVSRSGRVAAETPREPPPPASTASAGPAPTPAPACFPACRAGYVCLDARCVSMCNPPCPANQACVDGTRCELPTTAPAPYEPPPPPLPPKSFAERTHSALGFHLGFGGSVEGNGTKADLDSTLGFNIREDVPLARYVLIGPLFQFGAWRPDVPGVAQDRSYYVDVDLFVRGRIPIELEPIGVEFWGGVPIGLSLSFLGSNAYPALDGFGFGWNVGVLFGGAVHFNKNFGMFAELGWLQHRVSHDRNVGQGSVDFRLAQGNFNIGFVFGN